MKAKRNLWSRKRNTFLIFIVIAMIVAVCVSFISFFKTETETGPEELTPYASMYNASRYFFRVFYPDDWDVNSDQYGFMLSSSTGLVLEAFPLKKIASETGAPVTGAAGTGTGEGAGAAGSAASPTPQRTPGPTSSPSASASPDPRAGMERDDSLTISFYYKEYEDLIKYIDEKYPSSGAPDAPAESDSPIAPAAEAPVTPAAPSPLPSSSAEPAAPATDKPTSAPQTGGDKTSPVTHEDTAKAVFDGFKELHAKDGYTFSEPSVFQASKMSFTSMKYEYIKDDLKMSGEIYVATRAMAYYVIKVDGLSSAFVSKQDVVHNIIYNILFSVFDY